MRRWIGNRLAMLVATRCPILKQRCTVVGITISVEAIQGDCVNAVEVGATPTRQDRVDGLRRYAYSTAQGALRHLFPTARCPETPVKIGERYSLRRHPAVAFCMYVVS